MGSKNDTVPLFFMNEIGAMNKGMGYYQLNYNPIYIGINKKQAEKK